MSGMRGPKILRLPPNIILAVRLRQEEIQDQRLLFSLQNPLFIGSNNYTEQQALLFRNHASSNIYIYWHLFQISN